MVRSWKSEERMKAQRQESMWQQQSERESGPAAERGVSAKKTTFFLGGRTEFICYSVTDP